MSESSVLKIIKCKQFIPEGSIQSVALSYQWQCLTCTIIDMARRGTFLHITGASVKVLREDNAAAWTLNLYPIYHSHYTFV